MFSYCVYIFWDENQGVCVCVCVVMRVITGMNMKGDVVFVTVYVLTEWKVKLCVCVVCID